MSGADRMEVDDIIKRLAWPAKLYGGSRRNRECDQGSRARDWEIEDHDMVTAEKWGAHAPRVLVSAPRRKRTLRIVDVNTLVFNRARWRVPAQSRSLTSTGTVI